MDTRKEKQEEHYLEDGLDLTEDAYLLTERITPEQTRVLQSAFPKVERALDILDYYFETPESERVEQLGTPQQYLETIRRFSELFPQPGETFRVMEAYLTVPPGERFETHGTLETYLETLQTAKLGPDTPFSAYDSFAKEATAQIEPENLMQEGYRDRPHRARDYHEHQASRSLDERP